MNQNGYSEYQPAPPRDQATEFAGALRGMPTVATGARSASRVKSKDLGRLTFPEHILPPWGGEAARWFLAFRTPGAWAFGLVMGVVALLVGVALVMGNGMLSIKGAWLALAWLGFPAPADAGTFPPLAWWTIPAVLAFIESIARHIKPFRWLWRPAVVFDAATTALYLAASLLGVLSLMEASWGAAAVGLAVAVGAERALLGACGMLWTLVRDR